MAGEAIRVNLADENGRTALHEAIKFRKQDVVKALILLGSNVDAKDFRGATPLHA